MIGVRCGLLRPARDQLGPVVLLCLECHAVTVAGVPVDELADDGTGERQRGRSDRSALGLELDELLLALVVLPGECGLDLGLDLAEWVLAGVAVSQ